MKNILVPVDFSEASFNALSYAAFLANAFKAKITLLHAYNKAVGGEMPESKNAIVRKFQNASQEDFLKAEVDSIIRRYTVKITGKVIKGKASTVIADLATQMNPDLIIMGMKGKGESNSKFGSTTTALISKTNVALLVVPKKASYDTIETITVASDFSEENLLINFPVVDLLIKKFNPFIQILNVQKPDSKLNAELIVSKIRTGLNWDKYDHSFNIIEKNDIEDGINNFLKKHKTDLLVMIARKRSFFSKIFEPSHTKKMTHQTKIPLLILHK